MRFELVFGSDVSHRLRTSKGFTSTTIVGSMTCAYDEHVTIDCVHGEMLQVLQDTAESEFSTPLVSRCPTSSQAQAYAM